MKLFLDKMKFGGVFQEVESMNRLRLPFSIYILVLSSCCLAGCGATDAADSAGDMTRWQGTWKLVSCTWNGQPQTADLQWIVEGDRYLIRLDGQTHEDPNPFTLDASRKHIDVNHHDTPRGTYGGKLKGIYEVSEGSLRVCYDLTGSQYPSSFDAAPGSRRVLYQFRRER